MIGKIIDVNDETLKVDELKRQVSQDLLTKLNSVDGVLRSEVLAG